MQSFHIRRFIQFVALFTILTISSSARLYALPDLWFGEWTGKCHIKKDSSYEYIEEKVLTISPPVDGDAIKWTWKTQDLANKKKSQKSDFFYLVADLGSSGDWSVVNARGFLAKLHLAFADKKQRLSGAASIADKFVHLNYVLQSTGKKNLELSVNMDSYFGSSTKALDWKNFTKPTNGQVRKTQWLTKQTCLLREL